MLRPCCWPVLSGTDACGKAPRRGRRRAAHRGGVTSGLCPLVVVAIFAHMDRTGGRAARAAGTGRTTEGPDRGMTKTTTLAGWLERPLVTRFILGVILFNAAILGLETSDIAMARFGPLLIFLDSACLAVFVAEIALKLVAYRGRFFLNGWNLFDFVIVAIALVPAAGALSVLRALRVLRLLRVISVSPSLRRVVEGLVSALPGMGSVVILMSIIFYVSSVIATKLFGATFPEFFGSLGASAYSLFQIMTLESWSMGIVRPVMQVHPHAWAFFVPFILVTTFSVVNLLVGLIVNSMQEAGGKEASDQTSLHRDEVMARLARIEAAVGNMAQARGTGQAGSRPVGRLKTRNASDVAVPEVLQPLLPA